MLSADSNSLAQTFLIDYIMPTKIWLLKKIVVLNLSAFSFV